MFLRAAAVVRDRTRRRQRRQRTQRQRRPDIFADDSSFVFTPRAMPFRRRCHTTPTLMPLLRCLSNPMAHDACFTPMRFRLYFPPLPNRPLDDGRPVFRAAVHQPHQPSPVFHDARRKRVARRRDARDAADAGRRSFSDV